MEMVIDSRQIARLFLETQATAEEINVMSVITARMQLSDAREILMLSHLCQRNDTLARQYLKKNSWLLDHVTRDDVLIGNVVRRISDSLCRHINKDDGC